MRSTQLDARQAAKGRPAVGNPSQAEVMAPEGQKESPSLPIHRFSAIDVFPRPAVQAKLSVNAPNDPFEREADRVADQVLRAEPVGVPSLANQGVQRSCAACAAGGSPCPSCSEEEEEIPVQRKAEPSSTPPTLAPEQAGAIEGARGGGRPLDGETRAFMESRFGADFSRVRIHTDGQAGRLSQAIRARAFTAGSDIFFNKGEYRPYSADGRRLLAHELTHTLQQGAARTIRRENGGEEVPVDLCFVPIRRYHLSQVGGVHAVINIGGATPRHAEVNPDQHRGVEDPAAAHEGPGRALGLHSHVVVASGQRRQGECQSLTVTEEQADGILAAARRYESLDVVYEPPGLGPNSNSFGEWVLHEAGIDTSTLTVPTGAAGWGWYQDNPGDRDRPPMVSRTFADTESSCGQTRTLPGSFNAFVDLVRDAETQLIDCGVTDVGDRINILRGIYYGTPWSRDFGTGQQSHVRNQTFNVYAGTTQPRNPLECLDCGIVVALGRRQDLEDPRTGRHVDIGHLMIGLDARRSWTARHVPQPVGQVTGLEASTWAGDLGGGAARLAMSRVTSSSARAGRYFRGTDYGGSINLEGDIAGYAVAAGPLQRGDAPTVQIPAGGTIADALSAYFSGTEDTQAGWQSRCQVFLTAMGGSFDGSGNLTNRDSVLAYLSEQVHDFGCWYLVNYQRQHRRGGMDAASLEAASRHMAGASAEIAEMFLDALERCHANPDQRLEAQGNGPSPTAEGDPSCLLARATPEAGEALERGREFLERETEELGERVREGAEELSRQADRLRREAEETAEEFDRWVDQQRRRFGL